MNTEIKTRTAKQQYAQAYETHYTAKKLSEALGLYRDIMSNYPDSNEANYSQMQVLNIVKSEISKHDLFNAHVDLLLTHFKSDSPIDETREP